MKTKTLFSFVILVGLALAGHISLGQEVQQAPLELPEASNTAFEMVERQEAVYTAPSGGASTQSATLTWQIETVDSSDDVGSHTSLVVDSDDRPHISYYDAISKALKYAAYDGATWQIETVDDDGEVGEYTSLALDSNDRPQISYYDAISKSLKYAAYNGSAWQIETVDNDGEVGQYISLALDSNDYPHISYYDATSGALKYAAYDGAAWQIETVDDADDVGHFASLALDSNDRPHIGYINASSKLVRYANLESSAWFSETVYAGIDRPVLYTSLALDAADTPHLSWHLGTPINFVAYALVYATHDGSEWQGEAVDNEGLVGHYPSLALDPAGRPHISYYSQNGLKCAYYVDGAWYNEIVDDASGVGQYTSLALDSSGQPHISYYDETNGHLKHASDVPLRFQRRAAQLIEEMRGTGMAPGWDMAQLGPGVQPLYRPDVAGIAYYDFPVVVPGSTRLRAVALEPAGFVIVSTDYHDFPIPEWDFTGESPTQELAQEAQGGGESAAKFYKLDVLTYAAENPQSELVATLGELPPQVTGVDPTWLDNPPPSFEVIWTPNTQTEGDADTSGMSGTLFISGTLALPAGLEWSAWESWSALKTGYGNSFGTLLERAHREAKEAWEAESLMRDNEFLRKGDVRILAMLWPTPTLSLSGDGAKHVQTELITRTGLPPQFEITVMSSVLGEELPLTTTIKYPNGVLETFRFTILEPYETWLPLIVRGFGEIGAPMNARRNESVAPQAVTAGWTSWSHSWAGSDVHQRWYTQISCSDPVNTSSYWSGCGATAWAMLFGWADYQASIGNPYWDGRWGLYRQDGGTGTDVAAPEIMDEGVKNMTWEIRNDIDTWPVYIKADGCWQGATDPGDMSDASNYLDGRSYTRMFTCGSTLWPTKKCRNRASDAIKRSGGRETPAVIGISLTGGPHYALAYGYKQRKLKGLFGETWWTEREFYVNQGWGGDRGWVNGYFVWFAGEIRPHALPQSNRVDDVALYRTSDHGWYYDYGHNGDMNAVGGAWGKQTGDLPLAGDFDSDGLMDDVAIFRTSDGTWHYDYDHNGSTNEQSGPWGSSTNLPLAGDFDRDGFVDDIAIFDTSFQIWCYDYNHDNTGHTCDEWGSSWGQAGDLPFAGDFDSDGFLDDVAVFRPSTHVAYYDWNHDGTTDEEATHFTTETGVPVVGDFDNDGFVDDVAFFLADWEPTSIWFYDYDHNGPPNDVSEWGWEDGIPVGGAFGEDQDPL